MERTMTTSYTNLPSAYRAEAEAYVTQGKRPGALLMAVLDDSLYAMLEAAPYGVDAAQRHALICSLAVWARLEAPAVSRGSVDITTRWMESGGLRGRAAARAATAATEAASAHARATVAQGQPHLRLVAEPGSHASDEAAPAFQNAYSAHHIADTLRFYGPLRAL
jgi:hypothetical protein